MLYLCVFYCFKKLTNVIVYIIVYNHIYTYSLYIFYLLIKLFHKCLLSIFIILNDI